MSDNRKSARLLAVQGALIVLGAGAILQPAGAVAAPANTPAATPLKTNDATGHYLRKKLPGRMKSGQITIADKAASGSTSGASGKPASAPSK